MAAMQGSRWVLAVQLGTLQHWSRRIKLIDVSLQNVAVFLHEWIFVIVLVGLIGLKGCTFVSAEKQWGKPMHSCLLACLLSI
jgi:hypothetical protein